MSFNKIIIVGNLGGDPELNHTRQGKAVANFTMASNERRRDKTGEYQDVTTWFRVTVWGKQAETAAKFLAKGKPVYIEGRLRVEDWTDRSGKDRYTVEVEATDLQLIGGAAANQADDDFDADNIRTASIRPRALAAGVGGSAAEVFSEDYNEDERWKNELDPGEEDEPIF